jgi:quercetin dioxygenase-like cupin family protein
MKPKHLKVAFKDARGAITDLLDNVALNSVTMITSKKGVVRGNHFHKRTIQYTYILKGRVRYVCRKGRGKVRSYIMRAGDITASPPNESHAIVALESTTFLVLSKGPRSGQDYEIDTFRLEDPIARPTKKRRRS